MVWSLFRLYGRQKSDEDIKMLIISIYGSEPQVPAKDMSYAIDGIFP